MHSFGQLVLKTDVLLLIHIYKSLVETALHGRVHVLIMLGHISCDHRGDHSLARFFGLMIPPADMLVSRIFCGARHFFSMLLTVGLLLDVNHGSHIVGDPLSSGGREHLYRDCLHGWGLLGQVLLETCLRENLIVGDSHEWLSIDRRLDGLSLFLNWGSRDCFGFFFHAFTFPAKQLLDLVIILLSENGSSLFPLEK